MRKEVPTSNKEDGGVGSVAEQRLVAYVDSYTVEAS